MQNARHSSLLLACLSAAALAGRDAGAQGWVTLPNGSLGYTTSYVTSGMFFCGSYLRPGTCQSFGNSVILTNGASSMTMSFQGISNTVIAPSANGLQVPLGSFTRTWSGSGPFVLPTSPIGPQGALFFFGYNLSLTAPIAITKYWGVGWINTHNTLDTFLQNGNSLEFPVTPPPYPATYSHLSFDQLSLDDMPVDPGTTQVYATVSVTPEPATLALVATGLVGVFGVARRHRRKARGS